MEKQRKHQSKFISFALGGPNALAHFDVNEAEINQVINHVATLKEDILYK